MINKIGVQTFTIRNDIKTIADMESALNSFDSFFTTSIFGLRSSRHIFLSSGIGSTKDDYLVNETLMIYTNSHNPDQDVLASSRRL